ncbi:auxin response factor 8-like [Lolium rigidum]|uniref:auxin response factor 8-like n=1 Tax=Lolium rigidum TaxID=89674 RepID=UPI001F5CC1A1|nr:auxin response factor 8-like [Lolium rigidum]
MGGVDSTGASFYHGIYFLIQKLIARDLPDNEWRFRRIFCDESTAGEEKLRVSLWETESLTTFPMYPTAFFQTEASMGFRAAIYAWHVLWFQE